MKIRKGKIAECTEMELFEYWLQRGLDDIYPFTEYMERISDAGTKIIGDEEENG